MAWFTRRRLALLGLPIVMLAVVIVSIVLMLPSSSRRDAQRSYSKDRPSYLATYLRDRRGDIVFASYCDDATEIVHGIIPPHVYIATTHTPPQLRSLPQSPLFYTPSTNTVVIYFHTTGEQASRTRDQLTDYAVIHEKLVLDGDPRLIESLLQSLTE
jgi:hypothetical protein